MLLPTQNTCNFKAKKLGFTVNIVIMTITYQVLLNLLYFHGMKK